MDENFALLPIFYNFEFMSQEKDRNGRTICTFNDFQNFDFLSQEKERKGRKMCTFNDILKF